MNRLAFTIAFTENAIENIQNSEFSISDADIAEEISAFTWAQVLSQAATAMLAGRFSSAGSAAAATGGALITLPYPR